MWLNGDYLSPRVLQLVGLLLLLGSGAFWALTQRESLLLVSSAMTLILGGTLRGAWYSVRQEVEATRRDAPSAGSSPSPPP